MTSMIDDWIDGDGFFSVIIQNEILYQIYLLNFYQLETTQPTLNSKHTSY